MIDQLLKSVRLTDSETKLIGGVQKRIAELHEIIDHTRAEHSNRETYGLPPCWLQQERDRIHAELAETPSLELAQKCAAATMALHNSERTGPSIRGAITQAVTREGLKLQPLCARILESARADLQARKKVTLDAAKKGDVMLANDVEAISLKAIQLEGALLSERSEAARDPLAWLAARELLPATATTATAQSDDPGDD